MAALPFVKIFALLFKEASKPIAGMIKFRAQNHPRGKKLAMMVGRFTERVTQRVEMTVRGQRWSAPLPPVTDAHALSVGADFISQSFLIGVAVSLVLLEYWRAANVKAEESAKAAEAKARRRAIKEARLAELEAHALNAEKHAADLEARLAQCENQMGSEAAVAHRRTFFARRKATADSAAAAPAEPSQTPQQQGTKWKWTSWLPPFYTAMPAPLAAASAASSSSAPPLAAAASTDSATLPGNSAQETFR